MKSHLKILFISSSDINGGAARAAYRLFNGLREQGISVKMLVRDKMTSDPDVISYIDYQHNGLRGTVLNFILKIKNRLSKKKWEKYPNHEPVFLNDLNSISLLRAMRSIDFDVLHLHFVANRFLDLHELTKIKKPIVWTLHDCWPFTGICHYFYECNRYKQSCGKCPMLHSSNELDFTHKIWKTKRHIYTKCNMHIVTPSMWLGECAKESSLFRNLPISIIPNVINSSLFAPVSSKLIKENDVPKSNPYYILFGAVNAMTDRNKGFHLLIEALNKLKLITTVPFELLVFGEEKKSSSPEFEFPVHFKGKIKIEKELVELYNACDVIVVPSISENLSNTIMESLACGKPVVGFDIGGNSDMITHKQNGYLAKAFDTRDLSNGILWCLENNINGVLSKAARKKVEDNFGLDKILYSYMKVYCNF